MDDQSKWQSVSKGPRDLNQQFVSSLPDDGPVVMVNLVRFRERSLDGDGTGWDAYMKAANPSNWRTRRRWGTLVEEMMLSFVVAGDRELAIGEADGG